MWISPPSKRSLSAAGALAPMADPTGELCTTYTFHHLKDVEDSEDLSVCSGRDSEDNSITHRQTKGALNTTEEDDVTNDDDLVEINVSGTIFVTTYTCLNRFPGTLLGNPERRNRYWSEKLNAFYFNKHRPCFDSILHYYQTGKEAPPLNVDPDVYAKEKEFFGIKKERELAVYIPDGDSAVGIDCFTSTKLKIHNFLQDPRSSRFAAVWHGFDISFICVSIAFLIFESEPKFKTQFTDKNETYFWYLFIVNCVIMGFFTFDFTIRLLTWPRPIDFWKNFFNVLDFLSILPFYVGIIANGIGNGGEDKMDNKQAYVVLRVCRIFRIVRIFKFIRHSRDLLIIMKAVSNAKRELVLLVCLLFIFVITFGSIMYYIESAHNPDFDSIMQSCWWVIVTITTVGYGDMYPESAPGKLFGGFVLTLGIVFLALPMTIIVSKFSFVYEREKM